MKLHKIKTTAPKSMDKEKIKKETIKLVEKMREYQHKMYAQGKYSMLIVFQWLDASGKDGAIKKVFGGMNPLGCNAIAFKKPNEEEYKHDFLRRIHQHTPAKGMVQIFNRSYYEDILATTVEKLFPAKEIKQRYDDINSFEKLIEENDTHIVKFYLHISPEEQKKRLDERIHIEHKNRKFQSSDLETRKKWKEYIKVYEKIFEKCNHIPRHIIPSDQNRYKIYQIAKIIVEEFKKMKLKWPELNAEDQKYIQEVRKQKTQKKK